MEGGVIMTEYMLEAAQDWGVWGILLSMAKALHVFFYLFFLTGALTVINRSARQDQLPVEQNG